ncbi:MAG: alpha/beta fold hydrolase [Idiomarina sp.]|nr:alpha/beta fold hydrolase [Idiomarina sp.]
MRALKWFGLGLFVLLVGVMAYVLVQHWKHYDERSQLTETARENAPGQFAELTSGTTHYQWHGESDAPVVVLIHGFSIPTAVWGTAATDLATEGFRVLTYDLLGRGWSDRPDVPYNRQLYISQLSELLAYLDVSESVGLVGLSMGGAVAMHYASEYPARVRDIALVAPLHAAMPAPPIASPLAYYMLSAFYVPGTRAGIETAELPVEVSAAMAAAYDQQRQFRGFTRSLTSTLYHFNPDDHPLHYRNVRDAGTPVMLFWGTADDIVPFDMNAAVREDAGIHDQDFFVFEYAGHTPHVEHPAEFADALSEFLWRHRR